MSLVPESNNRGLGGPLRQNQSKTPYANFLQEEPSVTSHDQEGIWKMMGSEEFPQKLKNAHSNQIELRREGNIMFHVQGTYCISFSGNTKCPGGGVQEIDIGFGLDDSLPAHRIMRVVTTPGEEQSFTGSSVCYIRRGGKIKFYDKLIASSSGDGENVIISSASLTIYRIGD